LKVSPRSFDTYSLMMLEHRRLSWSCRAFICIGVAFVGV
jgi:hypothetical protein